MAFERTHKSHGGKPHGDENLLTFRITPYGTTPVTQTLKTRVMLILFPLFHRALTKTKA